MTIPEGYLEDAQGRLVPEAQIKDHEKLRDQLVRDLFEKIVVMNGQLGRLKAQMLDDLSAHVQLVAEKYGVESGGKQGNLSLLSFDGRLRIQRQRAFNIVVGEEIIAAEQIVRELLDEWTAGSRVELRALIDRAFARDTKGELSVSRLVDLSKVEIEDERWQQAVRAIKDALSTEGTTTYVRAYQRTDPDGPWEGVPLDIAAIRPVREVSDAQG